MASSSFLPKKTFWHLWICFSLMMNELQEREIATKVREFDGSGDEVELVAC